jgi:hypothetical protein
MTAAGVTLQADVKGWLNQYMKVGIPSAVSSVAAPDVTDCPTASPAHIAGPPGRGA